MKRKKVSVQRVACVLLAIIVCAYGECTARVRAYYSSAFFLSNSAHVGGANNKVSRSNVPTVQCGHSNSVISVIYRAHASVATKHTSNVGMMTDFVRKSCAQNPSLYIASSNPFLQLLIDVPLPGYYAALFRYALF